MFKQYLKAYKVNLFEKISRDMGHATFIHNLKKEIKPHQYKEMAVTDGPQEDRYICAFFKEDLLDLRTGDT